MLICDTSGLIAYFDRSDVHHAGATRAIDADDGPFVVSPYVLAELDHLLATRRGVDAEMAVLEELASGAWDLPELGPDDVSAAATLVDRYRDQDIGLSDASLVVLAQRYGIARLLTLDRRHFGVVRPPSGGWFELLPAE